MQYHLYSDYRFLSIDSAKGIDDKESGYDGSQERRELKKMANMLFG